ncbi:MAG: outer membrane beta-barrel family protein, partial [Cytophagales bacterium]|nr:outer membrane beta-barrel family protein [Cytophagales bacterium]
YTLDKNNSFSTGLYYGQRYQFRRADLDYNSSKTLVSNGQLVNQFTFFNSNLVKKQGDFSLANLDYTHTFANKSNLTVSALYEYSVLDGYTKNLNTRINNRNDSLEYTYNPAFSPIQGFRGKADYTINIGKGKLESGYQFRYQYQTGTFQYLSANIGTSTYTLNPFFSANIGITNRIQGLYSQYSGKWGSLEYVGGLRYEYAERVFSSDKLTTPFTLNLSNFFPSLNLLYSFKSNWKIKGGFSRRVQRSNSNELNPYPEREHSETMEQGDPKILPEFVNLTELGLIREFNSGSAFVTLYNQQIENVVNRVNNAFNDTIINRIYTNAGLATLWGLEAGVNVKPVKWWSIYLGGN